MTLTVGTNSYVSVSDANTYWLDRNNSVWSSLTTAKKEAALIEATQYLDANYSFIGTQDILRTLAWPRFDVYITKGNLAGVSYDATTIPPLIKQAVYELALEASSERLLPVKDRGGQIKKEKIDVIEIEYYDNAPGSKTYSFVTKLLSPLLNSTPGQRKLVRT
jgi:hypothetical protein